MRVGFEPTVRINPHIGFQDQRHRPLGHLTLAVGTGFEPARGILILRSLANFRLKPLGHPTKVANYTRFRLGTKPALRYNML